MTPKLVQLWETIQHITYLFTPPHSCEVLVDLWTQIRHGHHNHSTCSPWPPILDAYADLPFSDLIKIFFSLAHIFGFNCNVPANIIPNCIHVGNCLAHYARQDLCCPQDKPPLVYLEQFNCVIRLFNNLELLWKPHIITTKQKSIFLLPFAPHLVEQLVNNPTHQQPPMELTFDQIASGIQSILSQ